MQFYQEIYIKVINLPSYSSDLNQIENVCSIMKNRLN